MVARTAVELNALHRRFVLGLSQQEISQIDRDQIRQLNAEFFMNLSEEGVTGLTLQGMAVLSAGQLNALPRGAVHALSQQQVSQIALDQIRQLNAEFFMNLSQQGVTGLTLDGMGVLSAGQLNALSRAALSMQQVSQIALDQIRHLNDNFFRNLSEQGEAGLTLALERMAVLPADQLNALPHGAVHALSKQQVSRIDPGQIRQLNGRFFMNLSRQGIAGLTLDGMAVLLADQLKEVYSPFFSPEQVSAIIPSTFCELNQPFLSELTQAQAAKLTEKQVNEMSINQLTWLPKEAVGGLTSVQVGAIKPETIAGLPVAFFHHLSPAAVAGFTAEHMAHFTDKMIRDLDAKFFNHLSAAAVSALCRRGYAMYSEDSKIESLGNKIQNLSAYFLNNLHESVISRLFSKVSFKKIPQDVIPNLKIEIFRNNPVIEIDGVLACTVEQASCLTAVQVEALGSRVFSLEPRALGALTSRAVSGLSACHVQLAADRAAQVEAFSLEVIAALPAPFLSALRAIDAKQFTATQASRFTAEQVQAFSAEVKQVLQKYIQGISGGVAGGGAAAHLPGVGQNLPPILREGEPEQKTKYSHTAHQSTIASARQTNVPFKFTLKDAIRYYGDHFNHGFYVNGTQKSAAILAALEAYKNKPDEDLLTALEKNTTGQLYNSVNFSRIMHKPELSIIAVLKEFCAVAQIANERKNTPKQLLSLYDIANNVLKHGDEESIKKATQMMQALNDFQFDDKNLNDALKTALTDKSSALHRSFNAHRTNIFKLFPVINTYSYTEALKVVSSPSEHEPNDELKP